jgi:DNA-binding NarL/FixJ family response regulator
VLSGQRYLSSELTERLVGQAIGTSAKVPSGVESLSDRELEIFQLIGQGNSTSTIAEQLHLSVHTVDSHREKLRTKLNSRNGAELMQQAVQWVLENG